MYDIINVGRSLRVGVDSRSKEIELQQKVFVVGDQVMLCKSGGQRLVVVS